MTPDQIETVKTICREKMKKLAIDKQCPWCGRKMALNRFIRREITFIYCRWENCNYSTWKPIANF